MLRICIVAHNTYGAISGSKTGFIGGVEWQTSLMSKWFSKNNYKVTLLTWDEGGPAEEFFHGVRVIKICKANAGIRTLKFFHPKWTGLIKAMRKADADLYYHNCGECVTGQVALWCRKNSRAFIFSAASEADCDYRLPGLNTWQDRFLYRYGLKSADQRIVQTQKQLHLLKDNFNLNGIHIPMPCMVPEHFEPPSIISKFRKRILWVGRLWFEKRPEMLLEIARSCPQFDFDLVGPVFSSADRGTTYSEDIYKQAQTLPNVTAHGALPRDKVYELYKASSLLCCTSVYEGFPNTFLEAWSHSLPIVTTFDPDSIVTNKNLGVVGCTPENLKSGITKLLGNAVLYNECSNNARAYFLNHHTVDKSLPKFETVFLDTVERRKQAGT